MKKLIYKGILSYAVLCLFAVTVQSQTHYHSLFSVNITKSANKPEWIDNSVSGSLIMDINNESVLQIISKKENRIVISFPYDINKYAELELERYDIIAPGAKIVEGTIYG